MDFANIYSADICQYWHMQKQKQKHDAEQGRPFLNKQDCRMINHQF